MKKFLRSKKIFILVLIAPLFFLFKNYFSYTQEKICRPFLGQSYKCSFFQYLSENIDLLFIYLMSVLLVLGLIYFCLNKKTIIAIIWVLGFLAILVPLSILQLLLIN